MSKKQRRSIRLKEYNYSQEGWYFVTICVNKRKHLFGRINISGMILNTFGMIVKHYWSNIPKRYPNVRIDQYIIMPNHIHGIIQILKDGITVEAIHESPQHIKHRRKMLLPKIIGYVKMNSAKSINKLRGKKGIAVWQRSYWDRIIRNEQELNRIRQYIVDNPVKWWIKQNGDSWGRGDS